MPINRVDEFLTILETLKNEDKIKQLCLNELNYLRQELGIKYQLNDIISDDLQSLIDIKYEQEITEPITLIGNSGSALRNQLTKYRNAIKLMPFNPTTCYISYDKQGNTKHNHYALKYLNINQIESQDCGLQANKRVREDAQNLVSFDPIKLVNKAIELLDNNSYIDKLTGLYLLTGRRHEELLGSLHIHEFNSETIIDEKIGEWLLEDMGEYSIVVNGLVKNHSDKIPYSIEHELIPVLCNPQLIIKTIDYLRKHHYQKELNEYYQKHFDLGKKPTYTKPRPKGSKELGIKTKKNFKDILPSPSGKQGDLNPHNLRSAYTAILKGLYDLSENKAQILSYDEFIYAVIRHKADTTESSKAYLDYQLNSEDITKLRDFLN